MKDFNPILFADDTTIVHVAENVTILSLELNIFLYKISDWCNYNQLALNSQKSKWVYFSNSSVNILRLSKNNEVIERSKNVKYLGFNIDSRLNHNVYLRDI